MTTSVTKRIRGAEQAERRDAIRHLLTTPLITERSDPTLFALVVRNREWLTRWFTDYLGWRLMVDPSGGYARLFKIPARCDSSRPARLGGRTAFDRRRYALLCLVLAALEESSGQTTLARLVEQLKLEALDGVERFDAETLSERRALVEVLRFLLDRGLLTLRDGDAEQYASDQRSDALFDVDDRLLAMMLAAPVPPSLAHSPDRLLREVAPDTEEGRQTRSGQLAMRALIDDPVVYLEDLDPEARRYLETAHGVVAKTLERQVGLQLERRREGFAAVDPRGEVTDDLFPNAGSTVKHAALLIAEKLTEWTREEPGRVVSEDELIQLTADLIEDYGERCSWRLEYRSVEGARALSREAVGLLDRFGLIKRVEGGVAARAAIARFAPASPRTNSTGGAP